VTFDGGVGGAVVARGVAAAGHHDLPVGAAPGAQLVHRYAAAGHPPLLCLSQAGGPAREVEENGLVLGIMERAAYTDVELPLQPGDRFLLYTDGLLEAANAADELFGPARLAAALAETAALPPAAAAERLLERVDAWSGRPPSDDCTLVLVDWAR